MSKTHDHILRFAKAGFRVSPLYPGKKGDGKAPGKNWPNAPQTTKPDLKRFPANYGVVLNADQLVIDVDPRNGGAESWKRLQADLGINLAELCGLKVLTGGGGGHFYFSKPEDAHLLNEIKDVYPGVEMKSLGRQVVGPGSVNLKTKKPYKIVAGSPDKITPIPQAVLDLYFKNPAAILTDGLDDYDDSEKNINTVRELLEDAEPCVEGAGGDNQLFQTLCICRDNGLSPLGAWEAIQDYNDRCSPPWSEDELDAKIQNAYRYGQNAIGARNPKTDFEEVTEEEKKPDKDAEAEEAEKQHKSFLEELRTDWCYVLGVKRFVYLPTLMELDKEQFDDFYATRVTKSKPSKTALSNRSLRVVQWQTYAPGQAEFVQEESGSCVNMWTDPQLEPVPGDATPFLEFIDYLVGPERAWIINDYIAHIVRNPGDKILWTPLIQGTPGIGKSLTGRALAAMVGRKNVHRPTNDQMKEVYTGYMKNAQIVIVEELMAAGRMDLVNKLKDKITEPTISIREMHKNSYEIPNRANFLLLTNHKTALILPDEDRRFAVLFSKAKPKAKKYYDGLVRWLDQNAASVLLNYYLHEHQFSDAFAAHGHAPWTEDKAELARATRHPIEHTLLDLAEEGAYPMQGDLVEFGEVREQLKIEHRQINNSTLHEYMTRCGFVPLHRVWDKGARLRLWAVRRVEMYQDLDPKKLISLWRKQQREIADGAGDFEEVNDNDAG